MSLSAVQSVTLFLKSRDAQGKIIFLNIMSNRFYCFIKNCIAEQYFPES